MIEWFIDELNKIGKVSKIPHDYEKIDKKGMHFIIHSYSLDNYGNFATIEMKAMFSLMKMETIVFTPLNKDMPLLSYDFINAFGNNTLLLELYDTTVNKKSYDEMDKVKEKYSNLKDNDLGEKWYDYLKLSPSLSKKGKKLVDTFDSLSKEWISSYLTTLQNSESIEEDLKYNKTKEYVDGLFTNGGPSTDQFVKLIGKDNAYDLFSKYVFSSVKK